MKKSGIGRALRAFTLVEISVVFFILIIVIALSIGIVTSSSSVFARQAQRRFEQELGDGVSSFICNRITYATDINIAEQGSNSASWDSAKKYEEYIAVNNGRISYQRRNESRTDFLIDEEDMYGDDYYSFCTVDVLATVHDGCLVDVTVEVYNNEEPSTPAYTNTKTVRLLNATRSNIGSVTATENTLMRGSDKLVFSIISQSDIEQSLISESESISQSVAQSIAQSIAQAQQTENN